MHWPMSYNVGWRCLNVKTDGDYTLDTFKCCLVTIFDSLKVEVKNTHVSLLLCLTVLPHVAHWYDTI